MHRRTLLVGSGSALPVALAGCLNANAFAGRGASDATVPCNGGAEAAAIEPSARSVERGETIEFTLRNDGADAVSYNPIRWQLYKRVDGDWYAVYDQSTLLIGNAALEPGESYRWALTPTSDVGADGDPIDGTSTNFDHRGGFDDADEYELDPIRVPGLGGGTYAFGVDCAFDGDGSDDLTGFATAFDLDAPPLELSPTNAIASVERHDEAVVAEAENRYPGADGDPGDAAFEYELERVATPAEKSEPVIREQVLLRHSLRELLALALAHDVDRVVLTVPADRGASFSRNRSFRYAGEYYDVTVVDRPDWTESARPTNAP